MRKMFLMALAAVGSIFSMAQAAAESDFSGAWFLIEENGQAQNYGKSYFPDGSFVVEELHEVKPVSTEHVTIHGEVRAIESTVVQRGKWEMLNDSTIVEHCNMGDKGDVTIKSKRSGDQMVQTFAYTKAPDKVYMQRYQYGNALPDYSKEKVEHIPGIGSFGKGDRLVYIIDGKRVPYELYREALPSDPSMIERFSVYKDGSAVNMITPQERAAGKDGVMIISFKK